MSKVLTWEAKSASWEKGSTDVKIAVKAGGIFTYAVTDEEVLRHRAEDADKADKLAVRMIETLFMSYFMDVLSKKPAEEWDNCSGEFIEYANDHIKRVYAGFEYTGIEIHSIEPDEQYEEQLEDFLEEQAEKEKAKNAANTVSVTQPEAPAFRMDAKRILTIVVVVILLIAGFFMK